MLLSMTGFATKTLSITLPDGGQAHVVMNLKSVNARFFEVSFKLPYALNILETELIKLFKKSLIRGHISFIIHISNANLFKGSVGPALQTIKSYIKAVDTIKNTFKLSGELTIDHLIQLPNTFTVEEKTIDKKIKKIIMDAITQLIEELVTVRRTEGRALEKDLCERCAIMQKEIDSIEKISKKVIQRRKEEIKQSFESAGPASDEELKDIKRNLLYVELDKIDIHEEIIRFKSHLNNLKKIITSPEVEKGRRIDFILQELGREINTIAAKCSDATISTTAINIKVELEKIREQSQNIV